MSINPAYVGFALPKFSVAITPERLASFAEAIGETKPPAQRGIAPPTFLKVIEGEAGSSRRILDVLGVDLRRVLHAEP